MPNGGASWDQRNLWRVLSKNLSKEFHVIPGQFLDFKDHIMVTGKYRGISKKGKKFNVSFSHVYLIQENKIVQFTDTKVIQD